MASVLSMPLTVGMRYCGRPYGDSSCSVAYEKHVRVGRAHGLGFIPRLPTYERARQKSVRWEPRSACRPPISRLRGTER